MTLIQSKLNIRCNCISLVYLTIIPRARMCSESIAYEAKGRMGYWLVLRGHEGERNNCFSKLQLISNFLEIDFAINISDKKSPRFDLSEVIFKCIKVL